MGRGRHWDPDWITYVEAADLLGVSWDVVARLVRTGELTAAENRAIRKLSRGEVLRYAEARTQWLNARQAAEILGVVKSRVGQLADAGLLPYEVGPNGRRRYRRAQVEVIANARRARWHGASTPPSPGPPS